MLLGLDWTIQLALAVIDEKSAVALGSEPEPSLRGVSSGAVASALYRRAMEGGVSAAAGDFDIRATTDQLTGTTGGDISTALTNLLIKVASSTGSITQ